MPGAGETFNANTREVALQNGVNYAIRMFLGNGLRVAAVEPVEDPITSRRCSASPKNSSPTQPDKASYLMKIKLPIFRGKML